MSILRANGSLGFTVKVLEKALQTIYASLSKQV